MGTLGGHSSEDKGLKLQNPFIDTKLEYETDPVLWFSKRSEKISERGKSTFVSGTRGSGKTSILRSLSTKYICEIGSLNEQLSSRRLTWFGVYLRLQDAFPDVLTSRYQERSDVPVREHRQSLRFAVFAQYVELLLTAAICDDLVALRDTRFLKFSAGSEFDAIQRLFSEAPVFKAYAPNAQIETFRELSRLCRGILGSLFSAAVMSEGRLPEDTFKPSPPGDLIRKASSCLVGVIRGDRFTQGAKLRIKLLIDDCEVLPLEHQTYLNTLIRNTSAPISWVIAYVGSLYDSRRTIRDNQMLSDADREIEPLDEVSETEFKTLCQRIASLRLFRALSPSARSGAGIRRVEDCFDLRKRLGDPSLNRLIGETFRNSLSAEYADLRDRARVWAETLAVADLDVNQRNDLEIREEGELPYTVAVAAEELGITRDQALAEMSSLTARRALERALARKQRAAFLLIGKQLRSEILLAGERIIIALSDSCIRDFLDIMREVYDRSVKANTEGALIKFARSETPISIRTQSAAIYAASEAKLKGVSTIADPYGVGVARLVEAFGLLTKELQTGEAAISNPEIGLYRVNWPRLHDVYAALGKDPKELDDLFKRSELDGFLREVDAKDRVKLRPDPRLTEARLFRLHRRFAPAFGFSFRGPYSEFALSERALIELVDANKAFSQQDWIRRVAGRLELAPGQLSLPAFDEEGGQ